MWSISVCFLHDFDPLTHVSFGTAVNGSWPDHHFWLGFPFCHVGWNLFARRPFPLLLDWPAARAGVDLTLFRRVAGPVSCGVCSDDVSPVELEARGDDTLGTFPSGVTVLEVWVAAGRGVSAAVWYARFCILFVLVGVVALSWCVAELTLCSAVHPDPSSPGSGPASSGPWCTWGGRGCWRGAGSNILCLLKVSGGSWVRNVYGMVSGGVEVGCEVGVQSLVNGIVGTMKFRRQRCCWKIVHM